MKTYIKQCKFCINTNCSYKNEIKEEFHNKFKGLVSKITCDIYPKILPLGKRVETEIFTIENYDEKPEWSSLGIRSGYIWSVKDKLWYIVKLDTPIPVIRYINGKFTEILLEFAKKPLNKLLYDVKINLRK